MTPTMAKITDLYANKGGRPLIAVDFSPPRSGDPAFAEAARTLDADLVCVASACPDDIDPEAIGAARITYLEGYLFDKEPAKQAFVKAAELAHAAGRKVALSLSDPFCVDRHRRAFRHLVSGHVDVLFANEVEIVSLFEAGSFDDAVGAIRGHCEIAALTRGADGSVIVTADEMIDIAAGANALAQ